VGASDLKDLRGGLELPGFEAAALLLRRRRFHEDHVDNEQHQQLSIDFFFGTVEGSN